MNVTDSVQIAIAYFTGMISGFFLVAIIKDFFMEWFDGRHQTRKFKTHKELWAYYKEFKKPYKEK